MASIPSASAAPSVDVTLPVIGNFEGETPNPAGSVFGDYAEMLSLQRSAPDGRLDDFQRSKIRVWGDYRAGLGRFGSFTIAPIYRYNSGRTYSLVLNGQPLTSTQLARNPGYAGAVPVWRSVQPWIKFEMCNVLNNQKLIAWDTTITVDAASARDEFGLATGYLDGPRFGQGTSNLHYPTPRAGLDGGRMFDFAIGFRF